MTTERQCDSLELTSTDTQTDIREFQTRSPADTCGMENDIGKWPDHLTNSVVEYWITKDPKDLQNCNEKLIKQKSILQKCEKKSRNCTLGMFEQRLQFSGESVNHSWVCFSLKPSCDHFIAHRSHSPKIAAICKSQRFLQNLTIT